MLIDTFAPNWLRELDAAACACADGTAIHLMIDGAFVPGLHKKIASTDTHFLFEGLPGFNNATRDVSPFLVAYVPDNKNIRSMLEACSGWPMVSAITTTESAAELARRLAVWCVIKADRQYLNFRFPDTRRLPDILAILDAKQSTEFSGPATEWRYMGRTGDWVCIALNPFPMPPAFDPKLDASQFGALVTRSDADTLLSRVMNIGCQPKSPLKSMQYAIAESAMDIAIKNMVQDDTLFWCKSCLESTDVTDAEKLEELFVVWEAEELALAQERTHV
jgi:hypothetical protein